MLTDPQGLPGTRGRLHLGFQLALLSEQYFPQNPTKGHFKHSGLKVKLAGTPTDRAGTQAASLPLPASPTPLRFQAGKSELLHTTGRSTRKGEEAGPDPRRTGCSAPTLSSEPEGCKVQRGKGPGT